MNDAAKALSGTSAPPPSSVSSRAAFLWIALPLAALCLAAWWFFTADPLRAFNNGAPPVEALTFERTILGPEGLDVLVRAGGSEPMTVA